MTLAAIGSFERQPGPAPLQACVEVVPFHHVVRGDDEGGAGVPELVLELLLLVERAAGYDDATRLQRAEVGEDELRHVRHEETDTVPLLQSQGEEGCRKSRGGLVDLLVGEGATLVERQILWGERAALSSSRDCSDFASTPILRKAPSGQRREPGSLHLHVSRCQIAGPFLCVLRSRLVSVRSGGIALK